MKNKGFTLIELLIVIAIIAILAAVVIVALNPARQFSQARNTQRTSNVNTILNAIQQYAADNNGSLTGLGITTSPQEICAQGAASCAGLLDLSDDLVPTYVVAIPGDPNNASSTNQTAYFVWTTSATAGRVAVEARGAELDQAILVQR